MRVRLNGRKKSRMNTIFAFLAPVRWREGESKRERERERERENERLLLAKTNDGGGRNELKRKSLRLKTFWKRKFV